MPEIETSETIRGVVTVLPDLHGDRRGVFLETYRREWVPGSREMVQGNRADRTAGCLVGLHYHLNQADYWYVPSGTAQVVLHDLRVGSPTEGATLGFETGPDHGHRGVYIPPGVAHGFWAVTDVTVTYLVDRYYDPGDELGVAWDDPEIGAEWAGSEPVLSDRDRSNPRRSELRDDLRPRWTG